MKEDYISWSIKFMVAIGMIALVFFVLSALILGNIGNVLSYLGYKIVYKVIITPEKINKTIINNTINNVTQNAY